MQQDGPTYALLVAHPDAYPDHKRVISKRRICMDIGLLEST
jgi:hypothetical protein